MSEKELQEVLDENCYYENSQDADASKQTLPSALK